MPPLCGAAVLPRLMPTVVLYLHTIADMWPDLNGHRTTALGFTCTSHEFTSLSVHRGDKQTKTQPHIVRGYVPMEVSS